MKVRGLVIIIMVSCVLASDDARALGETEASRSYSIERKAYDFRPAWALPRVSPRAGDDEKGAGFFLLRNDHNAIDLTVESERETRRIAFSEVSVPRKRLFFEESLETGFKAWVYHPNLARFDIMLENGMRQTHEEFFEHSTSKLRNSYVNQYRIEGSFLRKKPYAFSLLADKSRLVENREFFERQIVYADRYAGNFGYKNKFIPVALLVSDTVKTIDRLSRPSQRYDDREVALTMSNESRFFGTTRFEGSVDQFTRRESDRDEEKGTSKDLTLTNEKFLTEDRKNVLYSSLRRYDVTGISSNAITSLDESLSLAHSDSLSSVTTYDFSRRNAAGVGAVDHRLGGTLRHQLYESLVSSLSGNIFHGDATEFTQDSYGLSIDEEYTKRLGESGRFSLGGGVSYSNDRQDIPNGVISVIDERKTLTTGVMTLLVKPRVDTVSVIVTDTSGTITYILNVDYLLAGNGAYTQITRVPAGAIANGQDVLVDYQAQSSPSLEYSTLGERFHTRLDLFNNLIGIYYRIANESHPRVVGDDDFVLQTLTDTSFGTEHYYKDLRLAWEYENFDSNLSPYTRLRCTESYSFNPTENSTLGFDSAQTWLKLGGDYKVQEFYEYTSTYRIRLNSYSEFNIEGGFRLQRGGGMSLEDLVAGAGLQMRLGKFQLDARYDYKKQLYINDLLINHFFTLRIRRTF